MHSISEDIYQPKPAKMLPIHYVESDEVGIIDVYGGKFCYITDFLTDEERREC